MEDAQSDRGQSVRWCVSHVRATACTTVFLACAFETSGYITWLPPCPAKPSDVPEAACARTLEAASGE